MNPGEDRKQVRKAERAAFHVAARVVMARLQRRRVVDATMDTERPVLGHVRLTRELISDGDRKRARLGFSRERAAVEQAVLMLISGAVAVDLLDGDEPPTFFRDSFVDTARQVLREATWWAAEAEAHLRWLRHRAVAIFAHPWAWRSVVALAQTLMADERIGERGIRQVMERAGQRKRAGGAEHFVMIDPDSSALLEEEVIPAEGGPLELHAEGELREVPADEVDPTASDGIVTRQILRSVEEQLAEPNGLSSALKNLRQLEPELVRLIEREASRLTPLTPREGESRDRSVAAGAVRCGVLVAEVLRRAHAQLWGGDDELLGRTE